MSVIIRGINNSNIGGGSSTGFPPGDISNIIHTANTGKILIKWTDPDDTILDEAIFVKWKGTLLVRNSNHYPTSIKDGDIVIDNTIKNKYKDTYYEDNNLINNTTYYYRFFPYSEDKAYNDNGNMIFKAKPLAFAPAFKDNTWEQIIAASESDSIPDTWNIGDEIDIQLSGSFNEKITLQIWDFKHFDKSDGSGKAGICFGMKHLMKNKQQMNSSDTNKGGWNQCDMRNTTMNNVFNSLPIELKSHIKEVKTEANRGGSSSSSQACTDKVFIPGITEVGANWGNYDGNQKKFPIFTDDNSRKKKMNNGSGNESQWWSRSPYYDNNYFCFVYGATTSANYSYGVCFCFNI